MEFLLLTLKYKFKVLPIGLLVSLILHRTVYTLRSALRLLFPRVLQGQQNLRLQIKN